MPIRVSALFPVVHMPFQATILNMDTNYDSQFAYFMRAWKLAFLEAISLLGYWGRALKYKLG